MNEPSKDASPSSPGSTGPEDKTASAPPSVNSTRSFKRRVLLVVGLVVVIIGSLYSWWSAQQSEEGRGWRAYQAGKYDAAIAHFSKAIDQGTNTAGAYAGRSSAEVATNQWDKALADSTEALRLDPKLVLAHIAKGNALAGLKQIPQALRELDEAIRLDPRSASAYFHRARVGYEHAVKDAKPLTDLKEAQRLDPDFGPAYTLEGCIEYEQKRYDAAIAACNTALALDRHDALALQCRGQARLAKGEAAQGTADIQQAQKLQGTRKTSDR